MEPSRCLSRRIEAMTGVQQTQGRVVGADCVSDTPTVGCTSCLEIDVKRCRSYRRSARKRVHLTQVGPGSDWELGEGRWVADRTVHGRRRPRVTPSLKARYFCFVERDRGRRCGRRLLHDLLWHEGEQLADMWYRFRCVLERCIGEDV